MNVSVTEKLLTNPFLLHILDGINITGGTGEKVIHHHTILASGIVLFSVEHDFNLYIRARCGGVYGYSSGNCVRPDFDTYVECNQRHQRSD